MKQLAREIISRIAMIVFAAILMAAGGIVMYMAAVTVDAYALVWELAIGLEVAGVALIVMSFWKSVDTGSGDC